MSEGREEGRKSLGDSSDDQSEASSGGGRQSVICYTERGLSLPSKFTLSSEESDSSPTRHLSSDDPDEGPPTVVPVSADDKLLLSLEADPVISARFTDGDPDYANEVIVSAILPPTITNWSGSSGRGRGGGGGYRGGGGNFGGDRRRRREDDEEGNNDGGRNFKNPRHSDSRGGGGGGYNNNPFKRQQQDSGGSRDGRW